MKNLEEFVKELATLSLIDQSGEYGHYPFQMIVETKEEKIEMNTLALGGDVLACYSRFKKYFDESAKRIYMSLDFPAGGEMDNDFIAVFSYENGKFSLFAIPYDPKTGKKFERIGENPTVSMIKENFKSIVQR